MDLHIRFCTLIIKNPTLLLEFRSSLDLKVLLAFCQGATWSENDGFLQDNHKKKTTAVGPKRLEAML